MRYGTGVALVLTAGLLWSFQGLLIRQIDGAGPWAILFWRSLSMLPVVFLFLSWRTGGAPLPAIRAAGAAGVLGGIGLVAAMGGAIVAFQSTTVANAAFLFAASPFLAAVLGRILLGEAVAARTGIAMAIALLGIFLMVRDGLAAGAWLGNIAALVSAAGFASFTVALRWRRLTDSLPTSVLGSFFAVIVGGIAALHMDQPLNLPVPDLLWCALMGAVTLSGGMILYTFGSRVVPSAELALLANIEVMLAPFWVWLLLSETASPATFLGGAIILVALLFNTLSAKRQLATA